MFTNRFTTSGDRHRYAYTTLSMWIDIVWTCLLAYLADGQSSVYAQALRRLCIECSLRYVKTVKCIRRSCLWRLQSGAQEQLESDRALKLHASNNKSILFIKVITFIIVISCISFINFIILKKHITLKKYDFYKGAAGNNRDNAWRTTPGISGRFLVDFCSMVWTISGRGSLKRGLNS